MNWNRLCRFDSFGYACRTQPDKSETFYLISDLSVECVERPER